MSEKPTKKNKVNDQESRAADNRMGEITPNGLSEEALKLIDELKLALLQSEQEKEKSEWLRKISVQLFESIDPGKIDIALGSLAEKLTCNRAYLRLKNPVVGGRDIVAESYVEGLRSMTQIVLEKYPNALQHSIFHLKPGQNIGLLSTSGELTDTQREFCRDLNIQHAAIISLTQNGKVCGELGLMSAGSAQWNEGDLQLAKEFSQLVSLIFEREAIAIGLRKSDERFNLAMEASQDGIWDVQIGLDRAYVSPSYFRMTGHDLPGGIYPREITGMYVNPDDFLMMKDKLAKFVDSEKANDSIEFRMRHRDGSDVWVLSRMYKAEFNADGSPSRLIGVNTDITEFKRIQDYLQTAQTEADSANHAKSEFLARMSHEIRTPMNAILGLSHLVLESELPSEQRNYVKHINDAAQLLLNVINSILDFSKIEAGKLELDETEFNLEQVINRLASLLIYEAEEKNIWLVIDLQPDVPCVLQGDVTRLQQILVNLLNNAIKFTNQGGVYVGIALNTDKRFVFTVKDSGIGIHEESLQFLFTPFSQADGSVTRRYGGTGLGLAICKYLVEMMDGDIQIESAKGIGSQFTVTLPFKFEEQSNQVKQRIADKHIAVISNNTYISQAAKNMFARWIVDSNIKLYANFRDFAETVTPKTNWLCLVDDDVLNMDELINGVATLRNRVPQALVNYVYLGKNNLNKKYNQHLAASIVQSAKPLTPEKIQTLLFPEQISLVSEDIPSVKNQWQHCKVLLVEDNPVNQKVALGMLRRYAMDVEVVADGQQAIDRLQLHGHEYYKLVLMDMEMPVMDGYAATREIRQDPRFNNLPIIAMTAHAMKGDRERCLASGMNDYISKPINSTLLHETLAKYLEPDSGI
jgi:PAS domain S-box-containing protein